MHVEAVLQDRPHRLPIDAGGLHRDLRHAMRLQPVGERKQPPHRGRKLLHVLVATAAGGRHAHARHHAGLVDVQRRRALHNRLHEPSSRSIDTTASLARSLDSQSNLKGGLAGTSPGFPARLPRQTMTGLSGTRERRRRSASDPASIPIFIRPRVADRP